MPHRVLIVDDEPDELSAWQKALARSGYSVHTTASAHDALRMCDEEEYDLVILDYVMPAMKGLELLSRIRKKLPLIRSIIISGKIDKAVPEVQFRAAIREEVETDRYLHKPASNKQLVDAVRNLLQRVETTSWSEMAKKFTRGRESSVRKARKAQSRLRKHLRPN